MGAGVGRGGVSALAVAVHSFMKSTEGRGVVSALQFFLPTGTPLYDWHSSTLNASHMFPACKLMLHCDTTVLLLLVRELATDVGCKVPNHGNLEKVGRFAAQQVQILQLWQPSTVLVLCS